MMVCSTIPAAPGPFASQFFVISLAGSAELHLLASWNMVQKAVEREFLGSEKGESPLERRRERERERERSNRQCRSLPARLQQRRDAQTALSLEEKLRHSPPLQYPHTQTLIYFHNFTKLINSYYLHFLSEKQLFFCLHFFDEFFFGGEKKGKFCHKVLVF
jgi:hypothetical protein